MMDLCAVLRWPEARGPSIKRKLQRLSWSHQTGREKGPSRMLAISAKNDRNLLDSLLNVTQKRKSGSMSMAQRNLTRRALLNTLSIGTSLRLHHATVIRGSR